MQRQLFSEFLAMYLPVVASLKFGHPLAVEVGETEFPELDFGPLISADKAADLQDRYAEAIAGGGIPITHRTLAEGRFLDGQDTSAYIAPSCVLAPPPSWSLRHSEPFGPLDSIVIVRHRGRDDLGHERLQRLARRLHRHR